MFTVVIPLYNKAHTVARCIASVMTQTVDNFEVVIINDGSTDNSLEVVEHFCHDSRIRVISQDNQGVSAARNAGIAYAKHDYIAFLDADDEWLPSFLEKVQQAIGLFPEAGMFGCPSWHRDIMTGDTNTTLLNRYKNKIQIVEYFENPHTMPHISATVVKKDILLLVDDGNAFPVNMKLCEDWCCLYRLAFITPCVYIGYSLGIRNNGVPGQITGIDSQQKAKLYSHVVNFYNLTYQFSKDYPNKSKLFRIFHYYELRSRIIAELREYSYDNLKYLLENINNEALEGFLPFEKTLYTTKALNFVAKLYIYMTKLIWRTHGFPIVGKN